MRRLVSIIFLAAIAILTGGSILFAQVPNDCKVDPGTVADIRRMLTAEDNGLFFEMWTNEEIVCSCIDLYYNDPPGAFIHDRVITGAVVLLGMTGDQRAVPVLIDAIDRYPAQALYNLGNFPTLDSLNALVENIDNENVEARENAAEGLRRMPIPEDSVMEKGWTDGLKSAIKAVDKWLDKETEPDIKEYFLDAYSNLQYLLEKAESIEKAN